MCWVLLGGAAGPALPLQGQPMVWHPSPPSAMMQSAMALFEKVSNPLAPSLLLCHTLPVVSVGAGSGREPSAPPVAVLNGWSAAHAFARAASTS